MTGMSLHRSWMRGAWVLLVAVTMGLPLGTLTPTDADAAVLCQRKKRVKVRLDVCKRKETLIQDLGAISVDVANQVGRTDELFEQFRLTCAGNPALVETPSTDSFYFDNIECRGACRSHDGNQTACEAAWAVSEDGATSCFYFKNLCLPCADCGDNEGACTNSCRVGATNLTCPNDPSRTIFAGVSGTSACQSLDNQTECEQAFHETENGSPASCYWNGAVCRGCGPNNENYQNCVNTCRATGCADTSRTTLVRCSNIGTDAVACADAWHLSGNGGQPSSCYLDNGSCRGCGFPNELRGECDNTCRAAP